MLRFGRADCVVGAAWLVPGPKRASLAPRRWRETIGSNCFAAALLERRCLVPLAGPLIPQGPPMACTEPSGRVGLGDHKRSRRTVSDVRVTAATTVFA
jgi:hypothetical protein